MTTPAGVTSTAETPLPLASPAPLVGSPGGEKSYVGPRCTEADTQRASGKKNVQLEVAVDPRA